MPDPTEAEILTAVRKFVAQGSGVALDNVIPGDDNHGAPKTLYASVMEITTITEGIDSEVARDSVTPNKMDLNSKGNRIGVFSVQFYRTGAADAMRDFLTFPSTSVGQIWMAENGLTWKNAGDVRNIDAVMASKWEQRRAVDIEIRYTSIRTDEVNKLDSVAIEINTSADGVDYTDELEVT